jgi:hypothetical protein
MQLKILQNPLGTISWLIILIYRVDNVQKDIIS